MNYYGDPEYVRFLLMQNQNPGNTWLVLSMIVGFLSAILYKREAVVSWTLFRIAAIIYSFSIVIPPLTTALMGTAGSMLASGGANAEIQLALSFGNCLGPIALAISFLCLISSMIPSKAMRSQPVVPTKHPLDP